MLESLIDYLHRTFPGEEAVTAAQFRKFLNISESTEKRMRRAGQYPKTIALPGMGQGRRILIYDLACWLERGGCQPDPASIPKRRGRPPGSRNRPKTD